MTSTTLHLHQMVLNIHSRQALRDLQRPGDLHSRIYDCHPDVKRDSSTGEFNERILYRVDVDRFDQPPIILVQATVSADWSKLPEGYLTRKLDSKEFEPSVHTGQRLQFRLRANPTKRVSKRNERIGEAMGGKRVGIFNEADQLRWLTRKGEANGFTIPGQWIDATDPETGEPIQLPNFRVQVVPEPDLRVFSKNFGKDENPTWRIFASVRFDGVLEVTNPERFIAALANGIGPGKGFGFGLLSVKPIL